MRFEEPSKGLLSQVRSPLQLEARRRVAAGRYARNGGMRIAVKARRVRTRMRPQKEEYSEAYGGAIGAICPKNWAASEGTESWRVRAASPIMQSARGLTDSEGRVAVDEENSDPGCWCQ
jgi:hypothetical protein